MRCLFTDADDQERALAAPAPPCSMTLARTSSHWRAERARYPVAPAGRYVPAFRSRTRRASRCGLARPPARRLTTATSVAYVLIPCSVLPSRPRHRHRTTTAAAAGRARLAAKAQNAALVRAALPGTTVATMDFSITPLEFTHQPAPVAERLLTRIDDALCQREFALEGDFTSARGGQRRQTRRR